MKALIVEDESLAIRRLKKLIEEVDASIEITGITDSIEGTVDWIEQNRLQKRPDPDLVFLDIELSDGQSFGIFDRISLASTIIFTTSYDEYALQAFKVNSIDYLLKPVQAEDLRRSLDKYRLLKERTFADPVQDIRKLLLDLKQQSKQEYRDRFLVKQGQRLLSVKTNEIAYFLTDDRYSFMVTSSNLKLLVDYSLDELEEMLDPAFFFRINRSMLVTHDSILKMDPYFGSRLALSLTPSCSKEVLVSREKVTDFKNWMGK